MVHVWGPAHVPGNGPCQRRAHVPGDGPISMSTQVTFNGVSWFQNKALEVGTIKEMGRWSTYWKGEIVDWN